MGDTLTTREHASCVFLYPGPCRFPETTTDPQADGAAPLQDVPDSEGPLFCHFVRGLTTLLYCNFLTAPPQFLVRKAAPRQWSCQAR